MSRQRWILRPLLPGGLGPASVLLRQLNRATVRLPVFAVTMPPPRMGDSDRNTIKKLNLSGISTYHQTMIRGIIILLLIMTAPVLLWYLARFL